MKKLTKLLLLLLLGLVHSYAQSQRISGIVISEEDNEPVIGATVIVKGTTNGTVTDYDGRFELNVQNGATLHISYIGMVTQEIVAQPNMRVVLLSDTQQLDDVIVVAYGTAKRSSFTGSASVVGARELESRPLTSAVSALDGKITGVQMTSGSGQPGESPSIRIRGFGSINVSSAPLYVVDGSIYNGTLSDINPNDIESMTVLKDAASTSLYGSSAGNGVILITTKQARDNTPRVTFNTSHGFTRRAIPQYDRVNVWDYYPIQWEMMRNTYMSSGGHSAEDAAALASANIYSQLHYNPFRGVANDAIVGTDGKLNPNATELLWGDDLDWQGATERTGYRGEYNLSYSSKTDKSDFYASLGYLTNSGYIIESDFERFSGRINANINPVKWFKTGISISANKSSGNTQSTSNTGYANPNYFTRGIGPIYPIHRHDPETGAYLDENGNVTDKANAAYDYNKTRGAGAYTGRHIVAELKWDERYYNRIATNSKAYMDLMLFDGLKASANVGYETSDRRSMTYQNTKVGDGSPSGNLYKYSYRYQTTTFNQLLNYEKTIGDHHFDILAGHESFAYKYEYMYISRKGQVLDGLLETGNFTDISGATTYTHEYKKEGYLARINYDYADKYYISGSYRRDGSSRFHTDRRWGNFWSLGASWRIDQEYFMAPAEWINSLKLRASYGETGNDKIVDSDGDNLYYPYSDLYDMNMNNSDEAGVWFKSFGNKDLKWETQLAADVAVEFRLFNKLSGTVEYFNKQSRDLLFNVKTPITSGVETTMRNIGKNANFGWEIELDYEILRNRNWIWNFGANITFLKSEIKKMSFEGEEIVSGTHKLAVGHSIYDFWLKEYVGVDPTDGSALYRLSETANWEDSDCRIVDGTEVTTNYSKAHEHYNGSAIPKAYGGFNTSVKFKDFDMSANFSYALGGKTYISNYVSLMNMSNYGGAMHTDIFKRWQQPGDVTDVPRLDANQSSNFASQSDRFLRSSNYLALRSLVVGYTVPRSAISRIGFQQARITLSGENLFYTSVLKGMDPQQAFTGVANNSYVPGRVFTVGLNITF